MANVYCSSASYAAVAQWAATTAYLSTINATRGAYVRQVNGVAHGSERVFRCTTSGTSGGTEPAWNLGKNATTADGTVVWTECTGQEADQIGSGSWKAPHARKQNAIAATWFAAGDTLFTGDDHAATSTTIGATLTYPGTIPQPNRDICVSVAGSIPPVAADHRTTATEAVTGTSVTGTVMGVVKIEGQSFQMGSAGAGGMTFGSSAQSEIVLKDCLVRCLGTTSPVLLIQSPSNSIGSKVVFENTAVEFGAVGGSIQVSQGSDFHWKHTAAPLPGATFPTNLFGAPISAGGRAIVEGLDLSNMSGKTGVAAQAKNGQFYFINCTIPASFTDGTVPTSATAEIHYVDCAPTGVVGRLSKRNVHGVETTETSIVRTGGAATTKKVVTNANVNFNHPFVCEPMAVHNAVTGSARTLTVYGRGAAVPNNDEVWVEVSYLGAAGSPITTLKSSAKATSLSTPAAVPSDASVWSGSTASFKLDVTLSSPAPALAGLVYATVKVGKASDTFYFDKTPVLS